jgi:hypothetical protein
MEGPRISEYRGSLSTEPECLLLGGSLLGVLEFGGVPPANAHIERRSVFHLLAVLGRHQIFHAINTEALLTLGPSPW